MKKTTDKQYGEILDQYLSDIQEAEVMSKEVKRIEAIERTFSYSPADFMFPYHMYLASQQENAEATLEDTPMYTPFKLFNRRRNFLVWAHSKKFAPLFDEADLARLHKAENEQFKYSLGMKGLSLFFAVQLRFWRRPAGRSFFFDFSLMYLATYCYLASNIPGVLATWDQYSDLARKMLESEKLKKRGLKNTNEFLCETSLPDYKCYYYLGEMSFAKLY